MTKLNSTIKISTIKDLLDMSIHCQASRHDFDLPKTKRNMNEFIADILNNSPIRMFILQREDDEFVDYDIIDGYFRLVAIQKFVRDDLRTKFSKLTEQQRQDLLDTQIAVVVYDKMTAQQRKSVFKHAHM
jgi:hypothetical protein